MRNAIFRRALGATLLLGVALSAQAAPPANTGKKLYCWDEGGRKVCGDALPATAAAAARTEISAKSGRTLDTVARAMTPEERTAAAFAAQQAQQAASERMQAQRRDIAMVDSYATEADLRRAYGDRSELLDASIRASVLSLQNLHQSLLSLLSHAADDELSDKPVAKPRRDATVTLITYRDQRPVGLQVVTLQTPNGHYIVHDYHELVLSPAGEVDQAATAQRRQTA